MEHSRSMASFKNASDGFVARAAGTAVVGVTGRGRCFGVVARFRFDGDVARLREEPAVLADLFAAGDLPRAGGALSDNVGVVLWPIFFASLMSFFA